MSWLKRHRWGVIALAVLVPASLLAAMSISWFRYTDAMAQNPVPVALGDTGTYLATRPAPEDAPDVAPAKVAAKLSLTSYTVVGWDTDTGREVGLLDGTEAVSAIIHVDARGLPDDTFGCDALLAAPGPEGERVWEPDLGDLDYYPGGDLESFCQLSLGTEFDWEAVFVLPEGIGDTAKLVITDGNLLSKQQLLLEH